MKIQNKVKNFIPHIGIAESFFATIILLVMMVLQTIFLFDEYNSINIKKINIHETQQYFIGIGQSKTNKIGFNYQGKRYIADCRTLKKNTQQLCSDVIIKNLYDNEIILGRDVSFTQVIDSKNQKWIDGIITNGYFYIERLNKYVSLQATAEQENSYINFMAANVYLLIFIYGVNIFLFLLFFVHFLILILRKD